MTKTEIQEGALKLPAEDRLSMVETLWQSLDQDTIPVPYWHQQILEQRTAEADAQPERFSTWKDARNRILQRLRSE